MKKNLAIDLGMMLLFAVLAIVDAFTDEPDEPQRRGKHEEDVCRDREP